MYNLLRFASSLVTDYDTYYGLGTYLHIDQCDIENTKCDNFDKGVAYVTYQLLRKVNNRTSNDEEMENKIHNAMCLLDMEKQYLKFLENENEYMKRMGY